MLSVVEKWRVVVNFSNRAPVELWISDNHVANVLRQIASMDFSDDWRVQPASITVSLVPREDNQAGVFHG